MSRGVRCVRCSVRSPEDGLAVGHQPQCASREIHPIAKPCGQGDCKTNSPAAPTSRHRGNRRAPWVFQGDAMRCE